MNRLATFLALLLGCSACSVGPPSYAVAIVEIPSTPPAQPQIFAATKEFAEGRGLAVVEGGYPDGSRVVSQLDLKRDGKIVLAMGNVQASDSLSVAFYADDPNFDWQEFKAAWEKHLRSTVGTSVELVYVPLDAPGR